jgi:hypothetical protein
MLPPSSWLSEWHWERGIERDRMEYKKWAEFNSQQEEGTGSLVANRKQKRIMILVAGVEQLCCIIPAVTGTQRPVRNRVFTNRELSWMAVGKGSRLCTVWAVVGRKCLAKHPRLITCLSVPLTAGLILFTSLLLLVSLSFPTSCLLLDGLCPLLILHAYTYAPFPEPFTSSWSWRQQGHPKCQYHTTTLHSITT